MAYELRKVEPPSDDKRWKIIQATMRRNGFTPHSLIEVLHGVQGVFGYLDMDSLRYVAQSLKVPLSKAYGVATFYHFFTLKPQGKHTCVVCMGTACFIKGANQVLDAVKENFGVGAGETTKGDEFSVLTARCIGACGIAAAATFDSEVAGYVTPEQVVERLKGWM